MTPYGVIKTVHSLPWWLANAEHAILLATHSLHTTKLSPISKCIWKDCLWNSHFAVQCHLDYQTQTGSMLDIGWLVWYSIVLCMIHTWYNNDPTINWIFILYANAGTFSHTQNAMMKISRNSALWLSFLKTDLGSSLNRIFLRSFTDMV